LRGDTAELYPSPSAMDEDESSSVLPTANS
jgi:hypothetical protein